MVIDKIIPTMDKIPNFIVFEGGDGSGTSTQISLLNKSLKSLNTIPFILTSEPTDSETGKRIRSALKKEIPVRPEELAELFAKDREQHLFGVNGILSQINDGKLVICDRYVLSSLVYQGIECGDELPQRLNSGFPAPEILLFFDLEPKIALERLKLRNSCEIYDSLEFQGKVRAKYKSLLHKYTDVGTLVVTIDASKSEEEIAGEVWEIITKMPIFNIL